MRLALIYLIACATLFAHDTMELQLYPGKGSAMVAQDYIDRANYMAAIAADPDDGGVTCELSNTTQAGPFRFHLKFPKPTAGQNIYDLSLDGIQQTNVPQPQPYRQRRLEQGYVWDSITLQDLSPSASYDYYYEVSIPYLEANWIKTDIDPQWKFATVLKFFFNATEIPPSILYVQVQCPVTLTRPKTVQGSYAGSQVTHLTSNSAGSVNIDLSISATLLPCLDTDPTNLDLCTKKTATDPAPVYPLNSFAKFILFLDNSDFAAVYYLIKYKVEMKSNTMPNPADFTAAATAGAVTLGEMTFKLPMAIVGQTVTVSAIATLSTTATRRRMMAAAGSKATTAAASVGVDTSTNAKGTGFSTYIFSIVLFLGMILVML